MKKLLIFVMALTGLLLVAGDWSYAQDPGNMDTLFVDKQNGRLNPNTSVVRYVWGYHDESLSGISIPLKYKTNQTAVTLDSFRFHSDLGSPLIKDTVINRADTTVNGQPGGTVLMFAIWTDSLRAGDGPVDTFCVLYFTTGASWDPATHNPIDTFRLISGQGVSYTDDAANDITPHYLPPGNLDVRDDPSQASGIPKAFNLSQNYPNPFNAETVISFAMPKAGHVKLEIYNILGQKVKDLVDEKVTAGYKRVVWDGKDNTGKTVASGVYFYKLRTEGFVEVMKMTLLK